MEHKIVGNIPGIVEQNIVGNIPGIVEPNIVGSNKQEENSVNYYKIIMVINSLAKIKDT